MFKKIISYSAVGLFAATMAHAGDTVTINIPGGAAQTISAGAVSAALSSIGGSGGTVVVAGGGADSVITSISQDPATGAISFTTTGGNSFTVSSAFIASILSYYGG
jgi:hypothetical protein